MPVVILSSSSEVADMVRGYQGGANSYVVKPVGFAHLAEAVSQLGLYPFLINRVPPAGPVTMTDSLAVLLVGFGVAPGQGYLLGRLLQAHG